MSLRKIGSPTGNLTYVVRDATDSVVGTSGTLDVSTLTGSFADYELSFSSPVTLGVDYHVAIEYNGGGVSDYLAIELKNETSETGYSWSQYTSSWSELTSYNIAITFDSNPTTVTKPTNVQDNSILVEKDTAKRYWRTPESANTSTDLDAVAWTNSPTGSTWGQSNNEITFANMTGSTEVMYYDVGTANISDTKWVLRFKLDIDIWSQGTTASSDWVMFGLSSTAGNSDTSQDSMVGVIRNNSSSQSLAITRTNGTTINSQLGSTDLEVLGATGSFYVEMIRTSDANYTLNVRSGSHSGTLLGSQDYTNASGVGGLRYIKAMNHLTSNTNADASGSFGEIELYNGVTSVTTPATWNLEGLEKFYDTTATASNADWIIQVASAGHGTRVGMKILAGSPAIGKYVQNIKFKLSKITSPSGNYQITVRDSSDTVKATANFSATGLPTSATIIDHDIGSPVKLAEGDRILFEYGGASGTRFWRNSSSGIAGFAMTYYNYSSAYVDDSTDQAIGAMDSQQ